MNQTLLIVGCGGFGREVLSMLHTLRNGESNWSSVEFADDNPSEGSIKLIKALGASVVGNVADAVRRRRNAFPCLIAVGSPTDRSIIANRLRDSTAYYPVLVHPQATVGYAVRLAEGVVIAAGARLSTNISIGPHVQIDQNATVGHDATIGAFTRLNPQACISGGVRIGERSLIGASAAVLQGLSIGSDAVVGASSCVTRNVGHHTVVKGVPAR